MIQSFNKLIYIKDKVFDNNGDYVLTNNFHIWCNILRMWVKQVQLAGFVIERKMYKIMLRKSVMISMDACVEFNNKNYAIERIYNDKGCMYIVIYEL